MDLCYCTRGDVDFAACPHLAPYAWWHCKQRRRVLLGPVSSLSYIDLTLSSSFARVSLAFAHCLLADCDFADVPAIRDSLDVDVEWQILSSRWFFRDS